MKSIDKFFGLLAVSILVGLTSFKGMLLRSGLDTVPASAVNLFSLLSYSQQSKHMKASLGEIFLLMMKMFMLLSKYFLMTGISYPISMMFKNGLVIMTKMVWQRVTPVGGSCEVKDDPPMKLPWFCWCMSGWMLMFNNMNLCNLMIKPSLCAACQGSSCVTFKFWVGDCNYSLTSSTQE